MKKCGFTLIELLAVIVILGIIALITVPIVNNVLEDAKISVFRVTLNNISKKANENCNVEIINNKPITSSYTIVNGKSSPLLEIKGDIPDGEITVDNDCNVTYELTNYSYVGNLDEPNGEVIIEKCSGYCITYGEPILNGAKPKLDSGMIPVNIENDGTVIKVDPTTKWYSYENKKWANVVLVNNSSRSNYKSAAIGTKIKEADIIGYFVWIPRYKYKISTGGTPNPSSIDIVFENSGIPKSTGNAVDEYLTHPGFTFGNDELKGIWVGKFETTGTSTNPTVLPNVASLRSQSISNQFNTALKFSDYGVNRGTHMAKNTEWASVAYLSHSKYGIDDEIRINNNSRFITGCGSAIDGDKASADCQIEYGTNENLPQSTTGNITGIFDMSGGAYDLVLSNYNNNLASSGFDKLPDKKYYDSYMSTDYNKACDGKSCLGHANSETKKWYNDHFHDLSTTNPWPQRGGYYAYTSYAGAFFSYDCAGEANLSSTFRVIIE